METSREHSFFIHNAFGHFFKDTLDFFSEYLYPRFEWTVIGTFDKAVEYIEKQNKLNGREGDKPNLPALILNPSGEFGLDDAATGGRQLWRFPNLAPKLNLRLWEPIYQDKNILLVPGFTRILGDLELIILCNSFYEYTDLKIFLLQIFGGYDHQINPRYFNSFLIIPEEILNYKYTNNATGVSYTPDWTTAGASTRLIKTTAANKVVFPSITYPQFELKGMSDGSERYGGSDKLAEWKLIVNISYVVEVPTFVVLQSDYIAEHINFNFDYTSSYSRNADFGAPKPPESETSIDSEWDSGLKDQEDSRATEDRLRDYYNGKEADSVTESNYILENRYYHIVTAAQADSTSNILIDLPYTVESTNRIKVNGKNGYLLRGDHFNVEPSNTQISIVAENVTLEEGDILELYIYKLEWKKTI